MSVLPKIWYHKHWLCYLLLPWSWLYRFIVAIKKALFQCHLKKVTRFKVPVIVVGNLTVGGTGKTPLVVAIANHLKQQGFQPGLVSRGYGGKAKQWPQMVTRTSDPAMVGDEAVLLVQKTACPMVVAPNRVAAVALLLAQNSCDVVISDDGLQHTAMGRSLEIVVIDGQRRLGNGFCLPAGPLREPASRLASVDMIVANGQAQAGEFSMSLQAENFINIKDRNRQLLLDQLKTETIHAVAGIGHPQRFFDTLQALGLHVIPHVFPDHHCFTAADISFAEGVVVMTEKDAVKCQAFANESHWYLPVTAQLDAAFWQALSSHLVTR